MVSASSNSHAASRNEQVRKLIKGTMLRHKVKPGITGWARANGLRGETETLENMRARIQYDIAQHVGLRAKIVNSLLILFINF